MAVMDPKPRTRPITARTPLTHYLNAWIEGRPWLRPSTRACYRLHIDRHLSPALGDIGLQDLTAARVEQFAFELLSQGLSEGTVQRILATLSSACSTAVATGLLTRNPVARVSMPHRQQKVLLQWNEGHARAFLDVLGLDSLDLLFRVALLTGMRRGELLGLRWSDLDLETGAIRIQRSRLQVGSEVIEGHTKRPSSARTIYADPATVRMLTRLRDRVQPGAHAHVFTDPTGKPLGPGWVSYRFARRIQLMGLPMIRFHDLRHASATFGLAAGESLKEVSQRLGHSDIGVTANIYTDVQPQTAKASAQRLASALTESPAARLARSA